MPHLTPPSFPLTVIGIGADGWRGLPRHLRELVLGARVVFGGPRQLALLPPIDKHPLRHHAGQRREPWPTSLREQLPTVLAELGDGPVVALASGDPLLSGIGSTLVDLLGSDRVVIHPAVSSVALARAVLGWAAESCAVVRVTGEDTALILRELAPGRRVLVLSADEHTPRQVADLLTRHGYGASVMHVLGNLGALDESRVDGTAEQWCVTPEIPWPRLHVLGLELRGPRGGSWVAGLPDHAFAHDGQLSKRDVRASALARLSPTPGEHLWDVGAGAGSVGIEWMRAHPSCTATAIERDSERADRIIANATQWGVPDLRVVRGAAPAALTSLRPPQAIFIGGGATTPGVIQVCLDALPPEGRLVIHGVTLDTEIILAELYRTRGGELIRLTSQAATPLGGYTGWQPARTVTQWTFTRPVD
ncbi:MAG: precorrin-6y C5,15-methyltransferase (decarboxylating) subunit CbiE [Actinomycetota bacterium]